MKGGAEKNLPGPWKTKGNKKKIREVLIMTLAYRSTCYVLARTSQLVFCKHGKRRGCSFQREVKQIEEQPGILKPVEGFVGYKACRPVERPYRLHYSLQIERTIAKPKEKANKTLQGSTL